MSNRAITQIYQKTWTLLLCEVREEKMICYKHRTYCSRACGNVSCSRNITDQVRRGMLELVAKVGVAAISVDDLKTDTCGYIKKTRDS